MEEAKETKKEAKKLDKVTEELEKTQESLEKSENDVKHWKNEYYKAYADMQNLRKSMEKDHQNVIKYRIEGFVENILPILDSFHAALNCEVKNEETKNYLIGFQYVYKNLIQILDDEGVKEITPKVGEKFDQNTMQAVDTIETEDDKEVDKISKVVRLGYQLHEHLIRPAMVVVNKKKEEKVEEKSTEENVSEEKADA